MNRKTNLKAWLVVSVFLLGMVSTVSGKIIFVDADANGVNDGSSWADAYNYLQDALADANSSPKPLEIRVAQGIYKPDQGTGVTTGDRTATFQLKNGVTIKGGYAGFGEPDPNARDIGEYETILSGDLNGNDGPNFANNSENSFHVVSGSGTDETAVLDGLTIMGGNALGSGTIEFGGGIYNRYGGSPTVTNCIITGNSARRCGGGMYNCDGPISDCTISGNWAERGGGVYHCDGPINNCTFSDNSAGSGGGLYECYGPIVNCSISSNRAEGNGGGLWQCGSISNCIISGNSGFHGGGLNFCGSVSNCIISRNTAAFGGGLLDCVSVTNCTIIGNSAIYHGGGLSGCRWSISNCVISGNLANKGGGIYSSSIISNCTITGNRADTDGGGIYCNGNDTAVSNSILWGNTATNGHEVALFSYCVGGPIGPACYYSSITMSYSNVQGGTVEVHIEPSCTLGWHTGNIDVDPNFIHSGYWDPNETPDDANDDFWINGDYHLKSQAGRWEPSSNSWVKDDVTSPCIDAGDMASPIGYEPFPNGGCVNMGAYGGTVEASKSYFGEPVCETIVAGDINGDCKVNFKDFRLMAFHWLRDENQ